LLNDILDFSKIEAGKFVIDNHAFRLREMLDETMKVLSVQALQRELVLTWNVAGKVPDLLVGDPLRLRQVGTNLVGNAIKFTERGSVRLTIEIESETEQQVSLHFAVEDTGIGISPRDQERIFAPFTQADSTMTRHLSGTGLGLAISAQLVQMMDGEIWVNSQ